METSLKEILHESPCVRDLKHAVTITKTTTSGGGFGEDTTETVVTRYDDRADVQDLSYELKRTLSGDVELAGDARVFFPRRKFPVAVQIDDEVSATYEGITASGKVVDIDRLDKSVIVKWL